MTKRKYRQVFFLLAPNDADKSFRYTLFLETENVHEFLDSKGRLGKLIDKHLRENFHYNYCRQLGQIGSASVELISDNGKQIYIEFMESKGIRKGDVKQKALSKHVGWEGKFTLLRK